MADVIPLTLGLTKMDPATEATLKAAFADANARLENCWRLMPESDAMFIVVDMDSMYGPMSWLRLHAAGKQIIGLSTAPRTQTHFYLPRPFTANALGDLLKQIAIDHGVDFAKQTAAKKSDSAPQQIKEVEFAGVESAATQPEQRAHSGSHPKSPRSSDSVSEIQFKSVVTALSDFDMTQFDAEPARIAPEIAPAMPRTSDSALPEPMPFADLEFEIYDGEAQANGPALEIVDYAETSERPIELTPGAPSSMTPAPSPPDRLPEERLETIFEAQIETPVPTEIAPAVYTQAFVDWLVPGALQGRVRFQRGTGPLLVIDTKARLYYGPAQLKSLSEYFKLRPQKTDFEHVEDLAWQRESKTAGAPQPLQRLQWFSGLMTGAGALLPGYDPTGRYTLNKWPETEREFPKHFRIATVMMKGPATVEDIAAASGMPPEDVADFINANLTTGFAEFVPEPPLEAAAPPKPTGLFGRLRGR